MALWNGKDPILKERLFGLSNGEGNHGEDVKEYYFYLDSTPTHSYMKWLYKYPQAAFPYDDLVQTNARRSRRDYEYELIDTGVFDDDRYFDVVVEYAEVVAGGMLHPDHRRRIAARRPRRFICCRRCGSATPGPWWPRAEKPHLKAAKGSKGVSVVAASHPELGDRRLYCDGAPPLLFTENDTNTERLFGAPNASPYVKDAFHAFVVHGNSRRRQPGGRRYQGCRSLPPRGRCRPIGRGPALPDRCAAVDVGPFAAFEKTLEHRRREADEFYRSCTPASASEDTANVMRQAFGGLFWTKQYFFFDVNMWLREHGVNPFDAPASVPVRNRHWFHMFNDDVISMPDKWDTRGTPRGISPFTRSRWRASTRTLPSISST